MTDLTIVLGIREECRSKGHGYLYWRGASGGDVTLRNCDLHEGSDGRIVVMFEAALAEVCRRNAVATSVLPAAGIETENMSQLAQRLLREAVQRLGSAQSQRSP
jgi:hypothetical protein